MFRLCRKAVQRAVARVLVLGMLALCGYLFSGTANATVNDTGTCDAWFGSQIHNVTFADCKSYNQSAYDACCMVGNPNHDPTFYSNGWLMSGSMPSPTGYAKYLTSTPSGTVYGAWTRTGLVSCPAGFTVNDSTGECDPDEPSIYDCGLGWYNINGGSTASSCRLYPLPPPPGCDSPIGYVVGTPFCMDDYYDCAAGGGSFGTFNGEQICFPDSDDADVPDCPGGTFPSNVDGEWSCRGPEPPDDDDANDDDIDNDGIPNVLDTDMDGDGTPNIADGDMDGDGRGNSADNDMDGDGRPNSTDSDVDGDGIGNGTDSDNDQDGLNDNVDPTPDGPGAPPPDADNDGSPDHMDSDDDNDGDPDSTDNDDDGNGDTDTDSDGDGEPDSTDEDDDDDGVPDEDDDDQDGDEAGDCDPTAAGYFDCAGLTEQAADDLDDDIDAQGNLDALEAIEGFGEAVTDAVGDGQTDIASGESDSLADQLGDLVGVPGCSDMSVTVAGKTATLECARFAPLRDMLGYFLFILTAFSIAGVLLQRGPN